MAQAQNPDDRKTRLKLVQVNFQNYAMSSAEGRKAALNLAREIATVPGLIWKIWLYNPAGAEEGGIYLFKDEPSADAYLEGEIFRGLKNLPGVEAMQVKTFEVNEYNSAITGAMFIAK